MSHPGLGWLMFRLGELDVAKAKNMVAVIFYLSLIFVAACQIQTKAGGAHFCDIFHFGVKQGKSTAKTFRSFGYRLVGRKRSCAALVSECLEPAVPGSKRAF